ncbi:MAG: DUF433 domain-containing protein [Candidatus Acididesulfobacter diazotrophicus]|jgi:uncharacterized protein (DUF433 family)|uniref:DUF433 domain-containing protein n=1 Tax=Candidatus Acididesulfobacter diazotrophicus TaxID=2597226 RepID=A0A519BKA2_9DELT|nr:MAG: DUF433 domain-containing protein [Candidatus Acididesulfobacter diazotrophicus]
MEEHKILDRITVDSKVMVGKPTIRGLRITVEQVLTALSSGIPADDLLEDYPELEADDIKAVLIYALELVKQERIFAVA